MAHELGHALGLDHSCNPSIPSALMWGTPCGSDHYANDGIMGPTYDDLQGFAAMYGSPSKDNWPDRSDQQGCGVANPTDGSTQPTSITTCMSLGVGEAGSRYYYILSPATAVTLYTNVEPVTQYGFALCLCTQESPDTYADRVYAIDLRSSGFYLTYAKSDGTTGWDGPQANDGGTHAAIVWNHDYWEELLVVKTPSGSLDGRAYVWDTTAGTFWGAMQQSSPTKYVFDNTYYSFGEAGFNYGYTIPVQYNLHDNFGNHDG